MAIIKQFVGLLLAISLIAATGASPVKTTAVTTNQATGKTISLPTGTTKIKEGTGKDVCSVKLGNPQALEKGSSAKSTTTKPKEKSTRRENMELSSRAVHRLYHVSSEQSIGSIWHSGIDWKRLSLFPGDFHGKGFAGFYLGDDYQATVNFCSSISKPCDAAAAFDFDDATPGVVVYRFQNGKDALWRATVDFFKYGTPYPANLAAASAAIQAADVIIGPLDGNYAMTQYTFRTANSLASLRGVTTYPEKISQGSRCVIQRDAGNA